MHNITGFDGGGGGADYMTRTGDRIGVTVVEISGQELHDWIVEEWWRLEDRTSILEAKKCTVGAD